MPAIPIFKLKGLETIPGNSMLHRGQVLYNLSDILQLTTCQEPRHHGNLTIWIAKPIET